MENLTVFNASELGEYQSRGEIRTIDTNANQSIENKVRIIGLESIDRIINELYPEIRIMSDDDIKFLSALISAFWFDQQDVLSTIRKIANEAIIDFIEGIYIIIQEENIDNLQDIQTYFDEYTKDFSAPIICDIPIEE